MFARYVLMTLTTFSMYAKAASTMAAGEDAPNPPPSRKRELSTKTSSDGKPTMLRFTYKNTDINRVIEDYAKASNQRFIVDGTVKGRITIFNPTAITIDEAFQSAVRSIGFE